MIRGVVGVAAVNVASYGGVATTPLAIAGAILLVSVLLLNRRKEP